MKKNKKKQLYWQIPLLMVLIAGTFFIAQQNKTQFQHDSGFVFGTVYNITYQSDENLKNEIESELKKVDNSLSMFNEKSTITLFNKGNETVLDDDVMFKNIFNLAQNITKETDGAFDITVAPLVNAWGFGFKNGKMPTQRQVDSIKAFVGSDKIIMSEKDGKQYIRKKDPRTMLDCSAIAKGYGSDVVADLLRSKGITNFMVEIGGEVVASGVSEKRVPWRIGITKPVDDSLQTQNEVLTVLNVSDIAMATSGNYRNFYYKNGKKYAHTIDPKTGFPVQHNILSSTVLAKTCATADAFATSFMVLGLDGAQKILKKHPELMVYFVYSDEKGNMKEWYSPKLKEKIMK